MCTGRGYQDWWARKKNDWGSSAVAGKRGQSMRLFLDIDKNKGLRLFLLSFSWVACADGGACEVCELVKGERSFWVLDGK